MTIKSDVWLRKMAEEHQMIEPFLPNLVREVDGRKIISAGCSSYGYDMRLADDGFRIFSSFHGKEIDPRNSTRDRSSNHQSVNRKMVRSTICCLRITTDSA